MRKPTEKKQPKKYGEVESSIPKPSQKNTNILKNANIPQARKTPLRSQTIPEKVQNL